MEHMSRPLVANNLLLSKMQRAKELANQEVLQSTKLKRRVTGLTLEVEELRKADRETEALLFEKSQEALRLYARNDELRTEVDGLKRELASRDEEMAQQKEELAKLKEELAHKDELFQQTKDELTSDVTDSNAAGFEDVMAQVAYLHPDVNLSQTGLNKTIADGKLVDAE